jgi:hypothetical protein
MAVTINTRQLMLESSTFRTNVSDCVISASDNQFIRLESSGTITPAAITLNAIVYNIVNPAYIWEYKNNASSPTDWTVISGATSSSLSITSTQINTYKGTDGTEVIFRVTTSDSVNTDIKPSSAVQVIDYYDELNDVVSIINNSTNIVLACNTAGTPNSLTNTGLSLQVTINGKYLPYSTSGANSWSIGTPTITPNSVTLGTGGPSGDNLTYTYNNITAITADEVLVSFPITIRNSAGINRTVRNTVQKFIKNRPGAPGLSVVLTNDSHAVPSNTDGSSPILTGSGTDIYVYDGATQLTYDATGIATGTWTISTGIVSNVTPGTFSDQGAFARSSDLTAMVGDTGYITYNISGKTLIGTNFSFTKTQTFSKAKNGQAATWYDIVSSTPVVYKNSPSNTVTGAFSPIRVDGYKYVGDTKALYGWLKITPFINGIAQTPGYIYNSYNSTPDSTDQATSYTVTLHDNTNPSATPVQVNGSPILDTQEFRVAFKGNPGIDPVFIDLTNDNVTIATAFDGSGGNYANASSNVILTSGTTSVLSSATITITPSTGVTYNHTRNGTTTSGLTTAANLALGTTTLNIAITALSQDNGTLTVAATFGSIVYTVIFTVSKAKGGANGEPAVVYEVESNSSFALNLNTSSITPSSVLYSAWSTTGTAARASFGNGSIVVQRSADGITWTGISTTNAGSVSLSSGSLAATDRFVRAILYTGPNSTGTIVDQETTPIAISGINGANGTSPIIIDLSNDNVSVATANNGTGGSYTSANTDVTLVSGTSSVLSSATFTITPSAGVIYSYTRNGSVVTGQTTAVNLGVSTTSLNIAITALSGDSGTLTVVATYNAATYTAIFTVSKAKAGTDGSPATVYEVEGGTNFNFNINTGAITPSSVTYNAYSTTGTSARTSFSSGSIIIQRSTDGTNWTTATTVNSSSVAFSNGNLTSSDRFVRAILYSQPSGGGNIVDIETTPIAISGINGSNGTSPVFIDLSNDNVSVATASDGTGGSYTSANTDVTLFSGTLSVLSSATFTITPSAGVIYSYTRNGSVVTGQTTAVNLGVSTTSLNIGITALSGDSGTLTVVATYNAATYTAIFTVSKAKAGTNGAPATVYEVESNGSFAVNVNTSTITPSSVSYSAFSTTGTSARTSYSSGSIVLQRSGDGTNWTTVSTTNAASASLSNGSLASTDRFVRAQLYTNPGGGGTLVDVETTPISVSGTNGSNGNPGSPGGPGPRNVQIYYYYTVGTSTAPSAPSTSQLSYNFSNNTASSTNANWTNTFPSPNAGQNTQLNKYWAILVTFSESTYGGSQNTPVIVGPFNWLNFDGLVTFTNLANRTNAAGNVATFIDGGAITTGTISVDSIKSGTTSTASGRVFGLGVNANLNGQLASIIADALSPAPTGTSGACFTSSVVSGYGALIGATETPASNGALGVYNAKTTAYNTFNCGVTIGLNDRVAYGRRVNSNLSNVITDFSLSHTDYGGSFAYHNAAGTAGTGATKYATLATSSYSAYLFGDAYCVGSIFATGNVVGYATSDKRHKTNIKNIPNCLNIVSQINGVSYTWTDKYYNGLPAEAHKLVKKNEIGVIAQEVREVLPEIVNEDDDGMLAVNYERIVPVLIEAIKELKLRVEVLEGRQNG